MKTKANKTELTLIQGDITKCSEEFKEKIANTISS